MEDAVPCREYVFIFFLVSRKLKRTDDLELFKI
jgi:hypothetical protein